MTPFPPPPRRVRLKFPAVLRRGFAWACHWATVLATLAVALALANELLLRTIGHDVKAAVTSLHERPDGNGAFNHVVRYTFTPGPGHAPRAGSGRIDGGLFRELQLPFRRAGMAVPDDFTLPPDRLAVIPVRAYALGPIVYHRPPSHPFDHWFWIMPTAFLPVGLLLTFVLHRGVVVAGRKRRRLFTHGVGVPGTITDRRLISGTETDSWVADYAYTPAGGTAPTTSTMMLHGTAMYEGAVPGREVTVLYDPAGPETSTVYELGIYRIA